MSAVHARLATACIALATAASSPLALADPLAQARLDPTDIASLAKASAGPGTSGIGAIRSTVLSGNPGEPGPYTIALHVPARTTIAAHTHRDDRTAVVVSGTWWFGYGPLNERSRLKRLPAGSFYAEPAGQPHFARTGAEPVVVFITGNGPSDTEYVDALADPTHR
jgi:quercetin dioxygenase-like cupin family protein